MNLEASAQKILNSLSEPVLLIDRNYKIVFINDAAGTYLDLSVEKIPGLSCYKVFHKMDKPCWWIDKDSCYVKKAFEMNKRTHTIYKHLINNRYVISEVVVTPLHDSQGESQYVLEEFRSVTEFLDLDGKLLLMCSSCKRIRDKEGKWYKLADYVHDRAGIDFSHAFCPECLKRLYPGIEK